MSLPRSLTSEEKLVTTAVCALGAIIFFSTTRSCSTINALKREVFVTAPEQPIEASPKEVKPAATTDSTALAALEESTASQARTLQAERAQFKKELSQRDHTIKNLKNQLLEAERPAPLTSQEDARTPQAEILPPIQKIIHIERGSKDQEQAIRNAIAKANTRHETERSYLDTEARQLKIQLEELRKGTPSSSAQKDLERLQASLENTQKQNATLLQEKAALTSALSLLRKEKKKTRETSSPATLVTPSRPLFANSAESLGLRERKLFDTLNQIGGLKGNALTAKYRELESSHRVKNQGRITFSSGKSSISAAQQATLTKVSATYREGTRYLIAGFADISGSLETNRKISSARAKAVAEALSQKVPPSKVQAIYFGQTSRFGPKSQNRAVEIWEIQPAE